MLSKGFDFLIALFVLIGLTRGFRRGLIREVFGLVGSLLAVAVAYEGYQELADYLMISYPLIEWQAQVIAFVLLIVGISVAAALFGYFWSRVIRLTPFALVDNIVGAGFGGAKVILIVIVLVIVLSSLGVPPVTEFLRDSLVAHNIMLALPVMYERLDEVWPENWSKPGWLYLTSEFKGSKILNI